MELQGDQLAVARLESGQGRADRGAAERVGGLVLGRRRVAVAGVRGERRGAPPPAQLVQRGVARDPEQPRTGAPARGPVAAPLAIRALEGLRGDVLGGRTIADERRDVGVDVVARGAVERVEVEHGTRA